MTIRKPFQLIKGALLFLLSIYTKDTILSHEQKPSSNEQPPAKEEKLDVKIIGDAADKESNKSTNATAASAAVPTETWTRRFDFLDGYRGVCALLVLMQQVPYSMKNPQEYKIAHMLGHHLGIQGFFVLSAFLLTYRFVKELDTRLERHGDEQSSFREQLKVFNLVAAKYTVRRFFRIYLPFAIVVRDVNKLFIQNLGWSHFWTMGPEIKYYFCIPFIGLFFVKLKRIALYSVLVGYLLVFYNEKYWFLAPKDGYHTKHGGTLASTFTTFFSGSLVAVFYYFYIEPLELGSNSSLPFSGIFRVAHSYIKRIKSSTRVRKVLDILLTLLLLEVFHVLIKHYGPFWEDYKIHTDLMYGWFNKHPIRLLNHCQLGILFSLILLFMLAVDPIKFTNFFKLSLLRSVGKYSFGIYLLQRHVLSRGIQRHVKSNFEYLIAVFGVSYFYGFLFFYLVENPLINLASYLCKRVESSRLFK